MSEGWLTPLLPFVMALFGLYLNLQQMNVPLVDCCSHNDMVLSHCSLYTQPNNWSCCLYHWGRVIYLYKATYGEPPQPGHHTQSLTTSTLLQEHRYDIILMIPSSKEICLTYSLKKDITNTHKGAHKKGMGHCDPHSVRPCYLHWIPKSYL